MKKAIIISMNWETMEFEVKEFTGENVIKRAQAVLTLFQEQKGKEEGWTHAMMSSP